MASFTLSAVLFVIGLAIALLCSIIGFFIDNVAVFDSLSIAVIAAVCAWNFLGIHPGLCVLICAGIFGLFLFLMNTSVGFWIISSLMSALWGLVAGILALAFSGADFIWFVVFFIIGFGIVMYQHVTQRD